MPSVDGCPLVVDSGSWPTKSRTRPWLRFWVMNIMSLRSIELTWFPSRLNRAPPQRTSHRFIVRSKYQSPSFGCWDRTSKFFTPSTNGQRRTASHMGMVRSWLQHLGQTAGLTSVAPRILIHLLVPIFRRHLSPAAHYHNWDWITMSRDRRRRSLKSWQRIRYASSSETLSRIDHWSWGLWLALPF